MVIDQLFSIKTDPKVLEAMRSAAKATSAQDLIEQRVSYVYGSLGKDSSITKEQIRRVVEEKLGVVAPATR